MANGMRARGGKSFDRTNRELGEEEAQMLLNSTIDWEALRSHFTDSDIYDSLVGAVKEATQNNNDLGLLQQRIMDLGEEGLSLVQKVVGLVR